MMNVQNYIIIIIIIIIIIYRRKQAKLQWLQNPSQVNGDNMDNVRREASRTFRTKQKGISEKQN
jgi:hypothetical protein